MPLWKIINNTRCAHTYISWVQGTTTFNFPTRPGSTRNLTQGQSHCSNSHTWKSSLHCNSTHWNDDSTFRKWFMVSNNLVNWVISPWARKIYLFYYCKCKTFIHVSSVPIRLRHLMLMLWKRYKKENQKNQKILGLLNSF